MGALETHARRPVRTSDLVARVPGVVWEIDVATRRTTYVSPQALEILGHDPRRWLLERGFWEVHVHPADLTEASLAVERAITTCAETRVEYRFRHADGTYRRLQDSMRPADDGGRQRLVGMMVDMTERDGAGAAPRAPRSAAAPEIEASLASLHKTVVDKLSDGVFYVSTQRRITYWNWGAASLTGLAADVVPGRRCFDDLLCCVDAEGRSECARCPLTDALAAGREREQLLWARHASGHRVPVRLRAYPIRSPSGGAPLGAVATFTDARSHPDVQGIDPASPRHADPLAEPSTGLPTSRFIKAVLAMRKDELDRHGLPFALAILDVDHLSRINAEHGSDAGSDLLRAIANTVRGTLRGADVVARWAPSELAVALALADARGVQAVAQRLMRLVSATAVPTPRGPVSTTVSIGAAVARRNEPLGQLYLRAGQATEAARVRGHNQVVIDDPVARQQGARMLGDRRRRAAVPPS